MSYATAIGLDVHARSITAVALSRDTGEVVSRTFGYDPASVAGWILGFPEPKAVYESGVTGFHLARALRDMGVDCAVGAVSKMQKPAADKRRKNDRNDAEFLARQLLAHNIVEVFVPDEQTEGARSLSRLLEDLRDDLTRAKHRLTHLLIRWGWVWDEKGPDGKRRGTWTRAHWGWIRGIELPDACAQEALDCYISEVRHVEAQKKAIEKRVAQHAQEKRWHARVEALRCMKGIETATAFALVVEAGVFSRFGSARAFSAWLGLVPSEHSSGGARLPRGHHQGGQRPLEEAPGRGLLALRQGDQGAQAGRIPRHRPPPHRQSCCGRDSPPRQAQGGLRREAHAPGGRERRHGTGALLLGVGAREDVRGNAVASA